MTNRVGVLAIALLVASALIGGAAVLPSLEFDTSRVISSGEVTAEPGSMFLDRTGNPTVVGEVYNDRGGPIENVTVTVVFFEDGERVGEASAPVIVTPLADDAKSPYSVRLRNQTVDPDDYEVSVDFDERDGAPYGGLDVTEVQTEHRGQDRIDVRGTVENTGDETVERTRVAITFYDENGSVIGVRSASTSPESLAPGEAGEFRTQYSTVGDVPSRARAYDDAEATAYAG